MMTPDKYSKVKEIFLSACDKPRAEQEAFIERAAGGDQEIRREVESLIKEHRRDTQVMPENPESPIGSMSAILSRANVELGGSSGGGSDLAASAAGDAKRDDTRFLEDSSATPSSRSGIVDAGRFMAGTVVAGRYRIIELLGRGGMGEVYRADDITLNQSIALKFLPALFGQNEKWLERFHNEVRLARQVTHPNVCRVFDIGEFQGEQFISMEYIDGENLGSLLRRIGRIPDDKGVQIARQLCAGLAAAHDRGVLHRDLKPANVMIDGRGSVRITDFGLAAPVDQMRNEGGYRAGTPAYMSPEQLSGRTVTVRSDIYSLGLILYEMFTGKRAFKGESLRDYQKLHSSEQPTPPSEIVDDIDPIVEHVIMKCLEKDPKNRPASAMAVSAALPGGNPLREILAAGETPSPEVVAAAGEAHRGLSPRLATLCFVCGIVAMILIALLAPRAFVVQKVIQKDPAALEYISRDMLTKLGYTRAFKDSERGYSVDQAYFIHVKDEKTGDRVEMLTRDRPGLVSFWYRESPDLLVPWHADARVTETDPPSNRPGMLRISVDPINGYLTEFDASPAEESAVVTHAANDTRPAVPDWNELLSLAHIDRARFRSTDPLMVPPEYADARAAWLGSFENAPDEIVRIEAAAYRGKLVHFSIRGNWKEEQYSEAKVEILSRGLINVYVQTILTILLLVAGAYLAFRNHRSGRGDRQGAARMAFAFFALGVIDWAFRAHHVLDLPLEYRMFRNAMGPIMFNVGLVFVFYLALEPYVRRVWPETIISWSRMLAGRWIDPLVGRDVLIGAVAGIGTAIITVVDLLLPRWLNIGASPPPVGYVNAILQSASNMSTLFTGAIFALFTGLILLLLLVLIRMILRNRFLIAAAFTLIILGAINPWETHNYFSWIFNALIAVIFLAVLIRHGLVAIIFCMLTRDLLLYFPITFDWHTWYASSAIVALACTFGILVVSTYAALGGRPFIALRLPQTGR